MNAQKGGSISKQKDSSLTSSDLVSLYSQQWEQIRHLDQLDFRTMTLLPIVVGILALGIRLIYSSNPETSKSVLLVVAIIIGGISFTGCYTTFRNWLCYMRRFAILNALEREMGMIERNIIEESRQFIFPKGYFGFNRALINSIRFPLTVFYSILGGCSVIIFTWSISHESIIIGLLIALSIFLYCNVITYLAYKKEFNSNDPK